MEKTDEILIIIEDTINSHTSMFDKLMKRLEKPSTLEQLEMAKRVLIKNKSKLYPNPLYVIQEEADMLNELHKRYEDVIKYIDLLIDSFENGSKLQDNALTFPKELNTLEAQKIFDKAIQAGLMRIENDAYVWSKSKSLLAHFADLASEYLGLGKGEYEGKVKTSWKPFETLFRTTGLAQSKKDYQRNGDLPAGHKYIDLLFK